MDDAESLQSLEFGPWSLGCNFFDTALGYGNGHSEGLLGQLVRAHPDKNCTPPRRFRRRTASGPPAPTSG